MSDYVLPVFADVVHYVVEDTFNNNRWRFEIYEVADMLDLLTGDEPPYKPDIYYVGEVRKFNSEKFLQTRKKNSL